MWQSPVVLATVAVCVVGVGLALYLARPGTSTVRKTTSGGTVEVDASLYQSAPQPPPAQVPSPDVPAPGLSGPVSTMPEPTESLPPPGPPRAEPRSTLPPAGQPPASQPSAPPGDVPAGPASPPPDVPPSRPSQPGTIVPPLPPPPVPPPPAKPYRLGKSMVPPKPIHQAEPVYPTAAVAARAQGVVILEVTITPAGDVSEVRVLRSIPLLDEAAIDAVKQWKYRPGTLNGVPVPIIMTVTVTFRLQ